MTNIEVRDLLVLLVSMSQNKRASKFVASSRLKEDDSQKYQIPPLKTLEVPVHIQEYFEMIKNSQIDQIQELRLEVKKVKEER